MDLESMSARSTNNASDLVHYNRIVPLDEARHDIENITNEAVIALANDLFKKESLSLVVVGPKAELAESYQLKLS
jgi:predicted Zn-dependent peptidase